MNFDRVHGGGWKLLYEVLKQVFEPEVGRKVRNDAGIEVLA